MARLVQDAGRVLRSYPGKATAGIHHYHDTGTGVLAASLAKRAPDTPASDSPPVRAENPVHGS
jgi:superfamily II DNA or RNA helicase